MWSSARLPESTACLLSLVACRVWEESEQKVGVCCLCSSVGAEVAVFRAASVPIPSTIFLWSLASRASLTATGLKVVAARQQLGKKCVMAGGTVAPANVGRHKHQHE